MKTEINRRDFIAASAAMIAATQQPLPAPSPIGAIATPPPPPGGTVVLFQGDSITDCGRDRNSPAPNQAGALGNGYPLLVTAAV